MAERQVTTETIPIPQARQRLGELVNRVYRRQVRVIVERSGIPLAALVSLVDLERCIDIAPESAAPGQEMNIVDKERLVSQPPTREELARRQALVSKILARAEERVISPLTAADLVHKTREGRKAHERWSH